MLLAVVGATVVVAVTGAAADVERGHGRPPAAGPATSGDALAAARRPRWHDRRGRRHRPRLDGRHERPVADPGRSRRHAPDPDQELVALGAANIATGFVQGFPISSSGSRTPVAESAGARTQLTGVVGAAAIAVMLVFFPGITTNLPTAALAAVVITACLSLVEVRGLVRLWRIRRSEFADLDDLLPGRGGHRGRARHLLLGRGRHPGLPVARVAAVQRRARPASRA